MNAITRLAAAVAILAALLDGPALAGSMEGRFGNTVVSTYPDGSTMKVFYNKDGTLSAKLTQGAKVTDTTGKWRVDGANVCLTMQATVAIFEAAKERCVVLNGDKVGDKWQITAKDASGKDITVNATIVAGR